MTALQRLIVVALTCMGLFAVLLSMMSQRRAFALAVVIAVVWGLSLVGKST